jgi:DNA invertase Pin-like site-specific DNA recombinase
MQQPTAARIPFYRLSSYNRTGGMTHPVVLRRMNQIMDRWAAFIPIDEIAGELEISVDTVRRYIRRARKRGDLRAERPLGVDRRTLKADVRRKQIGLLIVAGFSKQEIAKRLGCSFSLVQTRLKEAA